MRGIGMVLLALGVCAGLTGVGAQETKSVEGDLHGTWEALTIQKEGIDYENVKIFKPRFVFDREKYAFLGGAYSEKGTFKNDSKSKPSTLDLVILEGNDQGKTQLGIYHRDGDSLKICFAKSGTPNRPTSFTSKPDGPEFMLMTFKRVKKAKEN